MIDRILPRQFDNNYGGHRLAIWLLIGFVTLKLIIGTNTILNTRSVATGGDGLPLDAMSATAAQTVLMMSSLLALCQLVLAAQTLVVLIRYRAMIPFIYLLLLAEHAIRRALILAHDVPRSEETPVGAYINLGLLAVLVVGFMLSLLKRRSAGLRDQPG